MSFAVRVVCYSGVVAAKQTRVVQQSNDSVFLLREPYISSQKLVSNGATEVASVPLPANAKLIRVEVDDGATIQYEIRMGSYQNTASALSPALSGREIIFAGAGAVFAFVDQSQAVVPSGGLLDALENELEDALGNILFD